MSKDSHHIDVLGAEIKPEPGGPGGSNTLELARGLYRQGYSPIPIPHRSKAPVLPGWQDLAIAEPELSKYFNGDPQNIGVRLGEPSGWRVDVDLDCPEAIELATRFLPATATFGRTSKRRSHYVYIARDAKTQKFAAPDGTMLVEIRSTGTQTVFPGSTHVEGEAIEWGDPTVPVTTLDARELTALVGKIAAGALLARVWRNHARHEAALRLAGGLCGLGWSADNVSNLVEAIAEVADDEQAADRVRAAEDTAAKYARGENVRGFTSLREILGDDVVSRAMQWLGASRVEQPIVKYEPMTIHHTIENTVSKLGTIPDVYQRNGQLVTIRRLERPKGVIQRDPNAPVIVALPEVGLLELLSANVEFQYRKTTKASVEDDDLLAEWVRGSVPKRLPALILDRGNYPGVRPLEGITESPVLRADGTILTTPGFDEATGLFYAPGPDLESLRVPENQTQHDAKASLERLRKIFADFPYATPADQVAIVAALLTLFARPAMRGPAPMFVLTANVRGAGKTLEADVISTIFFGHNAPRATYVHDEAETRKRITSIAKDGDLLVLFDNAVGKVGNPALDAALTAATWVDRRLGTNDTIRAPLLATFFLTGNNLQIIGDTIRRVLPIRLDSLEERPEERTGFTHPDLLAYVREHRADSVADALTILRVYFAAGCPTQKFAPWGGFTEWDRIVRGSLIWAGEVDPCDTREELIEVSDEETDSVKTLLTAWKKIQPPGDGGMSAATVLRVLADNSESEANNALATAIRELCDIHNDDLPNASRVGNLLRRYRAQVFNVRTPSDPERLRLERRPRRPPTWYVRTVEHP